MKKTNWNKRAINKVPEVVTVFFKLLNKAEVQPYRTHTYGNLSLKRETKVINMKAAEVCVQKLFISIRKTIEI